MTVPPRRHSRSLPVIPALSPSFPLSPRHSRSLPVIPAPPPSFPLPPRHSRSPLVIPAPPPSFPLLPRHSRSSPVIPAPPSSFPRKRESRGWIPACAAPAPDLNVGMTRRNRLRDCLVYDSLCRSRKESGRIWAGPWRSRWRGSDLPPLPRITSGASSNPLPPRERE